MFQKHPLLTSLALSLAALTGSVGAYAPLWFAQMGEPADTALGEPSLYQMVVCPGGLGLGLSVLAAFWTGQTVWRIVRAQGRGSESRQWLLVAFAASIFASAAGSVVVGVAWLVVATG